ncbi:MAG TPA: ROK family protein [Gaiellaceae bacterium]|nr:ROK family protein [Gaiellaceae bacterium]
MSGTHAIGVDLGGTKILAGVVTREGEVLRRHERATPETQDELLDELDAAIEELRDDTVAAIGLGIPAPIDQRSGRVFPAVNTPLANIDLRDRMADRHGLPIGLDNDANAACNAEWRAGAARGATDVVMLTLGTGCGGGLILNGRPFRGSTGAGVELGHVVIVHDGRPCQGRCTGRGHLEAYVTGVAAAAAAREAFGPAADAHRLVRLANEGDEIARGILADIGGYLGSGMGSFVNIFEPQVLVIGGGFGIAAWDYLIPAAQEILDREALQPMKDEVRVVRAELGTAAGLIGAAFVAFEALDEA